MDLIRGDLVEVHWVDITEDPVGDPSKAELPLQINIGYFYEKKMSRDMPIIVTTTSVISDDQSGYAVYPECIVVRIKMIRKKRRPKKKSEAGNELGKAPKGSSKDS